MADETNTSDTQSSTATTDQSAASTDQYSSTTPSQEQTIQQADGEADDKAGSTLLTGADGGPDGDGGDVSGDEGDKSADDTNVNDLLGAPDGDYEINLGEGVTADKEAIGMIAPLAKEIGLSNLGMNKLAGVYAEKVLPHVTTQVTEQIVANIQADHAQQLKDWDAETRLAIQGGKDKDGNAVAPDPDYGGKSLKDVVATASKAVRRFGGNGLADYLEKTGLGNDPRMVKAMFKAGSAISEDATFERGAVTGKKTDAEIFYGSNT